MVRRIRESLHRQNEGLKVLGILLAEEFTQLTDGQPKLISLTELSVQELMRQLTAEKLSLKTVVSRLSPNNPVARLKDALCLLPGENAKPLLELLEEIDAREQSCVKQAEKNFNLALGLLDQSKSLLEHLRREITPNKNTNGYSARGRYANPAPATASLVHGRL